MDLDLTTFADENFNPRSWINEVFHDAEKVEKDAPTLIMRLQLAIQEVNLQLEDTSQQVLAVLPRLVKDVGALGEEADLLRASMAELVEDAGQAAEGGPAPLARLEALDRVAGRLRDTSSALRQADDWTTTAGELEELLEAGDLPAAAASVGRLTALAQAAGSADRDALINSCQLRIEALASPYVVEAFNKEDLEEAQRYVGVLRAVGRVGQAAAYYQQCGAGRLRKGWRGEPCLPALTAYLDAVAAWVTRQVSWVAAVFPEEDARATLRQVALLAVSDLEPPLQQVVASLAKTEADPVACLGDVRRRMDDFGRQLAACVGDDGQLTGALYSTLPPLLPLVSAHEGARLLSLLQTADLGAGELTDRLTNLRQFCSRVPQMCQETTARCQQAVGSLALGAVVGAEEGLVAALAAHLQGARGRLGAEQVAGQQWAVFGPALDLIHTAGEVLVTAEHCEQTLTSVFGGAAGEDAASAFTSPSSLGGGEGVPDPPLDRALPPLRQEVEACVSSSLAAMVEPLRRHTSPLPLPLPSAGAPPLSSSLSPQEYVTEMGHYLLTLPQHLEPLLSSPSPALNRALQQLSEEDSHPGARGVSESELSAADFLLGRIAGAAVRALCDAVRGLASLGPAQAAQLATDVEYLTHILSDLGVGGGPLLLLLSLLRTPPGEWGERAPGEGDDPSLVAAVRQLRGIPGET